MFCCMNPHHSSAGKKSLNPILRSKMTEIFVDELDKTKDILPIVELNLSSLFDPDYINKITSFYLSIKEKIRQLLIHYGTKKPSIGLRNLVRALKYIEAALNNKEVTFGSLRALYEALILNFTTQVDPESKKLMVQMIHETIFDGKPPNKETMASLKFSSSANKDDYVLFENYAIKKGLFDPVKKLGAEPDWEEKFIMTSTFKNLVKTFASIICCTNYAILIEGPTSAGKTSTIEYLAKKTHNKCIRINNHEHTDIEEYIGSYIPDAKGKLIFQEGLLVEAVRNGYWVILDELNLAPSEVLEALNRLLDDNNELFIVETQEVIKAHPKFRLFATQNPTEGYGGRKELSEAFKNRFIILHAEEIPHNELSTIVHKRCAMAESHAKKLVAIMKDLQFYRQDSGIFRGTDSVITVRDLLKWASRYTITLDDIAHEGYILLAERMRDTSDKEFVKKIIEKHCKLIIDIDAYYDKYFDENLKDLFKLEDDSVLAELGIRNVIVTKTLKKLAVLVHKCLVNKEPVLLVGETGCGKTTICQLLALHMQQQLFSINVHQNTETSDFIGCMRTKRDKLAKIEALNKEIIQIVSVLETESEEVKSMIENVSDEELSTKISAKTYSKYLKTLKVLVQANPTPEITSMLSNANVILINIKSIFEWQDGVLINAMKNGGLLLIDEISLANDSVLERLNSVFETERTLVLAEKASTTAIKIVATEQFGIVSTMNPSGDFGKKELSPALRNRMTEIWVESYFDQKELRDYASFLATNAISELKSGLVMKSSDLFVIITEKLGDKAVAEMLFKLIVFYNFIIVPKYNLTRKKLSIRDVLNFIEFYKKSEDLETTKRFREGVKLVIIDGIGIDTCIEKDNILAKLEKFVTSLYENDTMEIDEELSVIYDDAQFGITPYILKNTSSQMLQDSFSFEATKHNVVKILRGLRLGKPILLEGPPGVGKTSTVENIAKAIGKKIIRINLSEHTDMMDLLGSEYPVPVSSNSQGQSEDITFQWCDGALLTAIKHGYWFLLDEMNLAHQSVLEGLNAILDHRQTVYIPELNQEFKCHPDFFIFASQNPIEHGIGRKNLPKSFLNRFTKINLEDLSDENYFDIIKCRFGHFCADDEIKSFISMTHQLETLLHEDKVKYSNEMSFDSHEKFNLRDLTRFFLVYSSPDYIHLSKEVRLFRAFEINCSKFISHEYRNLALQAFNKTLGLNCNFTKSFIIKNTMNEIEYYLPSISEIEGVVLSQSKTLGSTEQDESRKHITSTPYNLTHGVYSYYLYLLTICVQNRWPTLLIGKKSVGKTSLIHTLSKLTNNRCIDITLSPQTDTTDILGSYQQVNHRGKAQFVWQDSVLVKAIQDGDWVIIENFNHRGGATAIVLDRLNSLLEEGNEELVINEAGLIEGELKRVKAHPNFRIFFVLNEETMMYSTISKPLRNRCCEIYVREMEMNDIQATVVAVCNNMGIHGSKIPLELFKIHMKAISKNNEEIEDYQLPKFFKWMQNICNSHKFAKLK